MSATLVPVASLASLAVASPWSRSLTLPPLGNLDAYISAVNRLPLLTLDYFLLLKLLSKNYFNEVLSKQSLPRKLWH